MVAAFGRLLHAGGLGARRPIAARACVLGGIFVYFHAGQQCRQTRVAPGFLVQDVSPCIGRNRTLNQGVVGSKPTWPTKET